MVQLPAARIILLIVFFLNDTATTEIYTLSLHDALPIWSCNGWKGWNAPGHGTFSPLTLTGISDRKSTRLNSSHGYISYAVFCLLKKEGVAVIDGPELAGPAATADLFVELPRRRPARPRARRSLLTVRCALPLLLAFFCRRAAPRRLSPPPPGPPR